MEAGSTIQLLRFLRLRFCAKNLQARILCALAAPYTLRCFPGGRQYGIQYGHGARNSRTSKPAYLATTSAQNSSLPLVTHSGSQCEASMTDGSTQRTLG